MGFFGSLLSGAKSLIGSIFGDGESSSSTRNSTHSSTRSYTHSSTHSSTSVSNTQTIYEPDKVKVTELENARMSRAIEAQKEIMQMNAQMQFAIIEAQQKGFERATEILKEMMISLNNIAQERLVLIENGHFEVVEKIEKLYMELEKEIRNDSTSFNLNELPKMLALLQQFPQESPSAKLYEKSIDKQIEMNMTFFTQKLNALHERQKLMVISAIASKEQILEQSSQIVLARIAFLDKQLQEQKNIQLIQNQSQNINAISSKSNYDDVEVKLIER